MSDAVGVFFGISALVGFVFFSVVGAKLFLFIVGFLCVTISYFFDKYLKPFSRPSMLFQTSEQGNRRGNKANYAIQVKDYTQRFKERCCRAKIAESRTVACNRFNSRLADDSEDNTTNLSYGRFQDVVNPPIENICQHSNAKVSHEKGASQPKVNDTNTIRNLTYY